MSRNHFEATELIPMPCVETMSRNQTGGTELIPMPHPTGAAQLSLPIILYSALGSRTARTQGQCPMSHISALRRELDSEQVEQVESKWPNMSNFLKMNPKCL